MFGRGCVSIRCCQRVVAALVLLLLPGVATPQESAPALNLSGPVMRSLPNDFRADVRRLTLADAQQLAQAASDPLKRLGELQVEAARQHRLGVKSMYFPSVATQFLNLHLSTQPGELL